MNNIGKRIRDLRKKNDLTQEKLADYLGVTYQSVSKWECGDSLPDTDNLITISKLFGVSLDELVGNTCEDAIAVEAVKSESKSCVRRNAVLERIEKETETVVRLLKCKSKKTKHLLLNIALVNSNATTTKLSTVKYNIVSFCSYCARIGIKKL